VVQVHNFSYGLLTPAIAYAMSCLGAFLGLRCNARARASTGRIRVGWLLLAALSIGITGIWVMHFVAMLGFTIPGQTIRYDVPVTILSALVAVAVVSIGLLIVGLSSQGNAPLILGGLIIGFGVASMHYIGMAAMQMQGAMRYNNFLVALSVLIAVVAGTAALWAGRIRQFWATIAASLIMGVAVSGMHYTGMAAMRVYQAPGSGAMVGGATAGGFLLPLIVGIGSLTFILTAAIALSPTEQELRDDAALMARINQGNELWQAGRDSGAAR
jgi:NO-binding membrane sensor protein with MHYT domain